MQLLKIASTFLTDWILMSRADVQLEPVYTNCETAEAAWSCEIKYLSQQCLSTVKYGKESKHKNLLLSALIHVMKWSEGLSHVQLFLTPWTLAHRASLSMGFLRQEYWSEQLFPSSGHLPDPEIKPRPPTLQADSLISEPLGKPNTCHREVILC